MPEQAPTPLFTITPQSVAGHQSCPSNDIGLKLNHGPPQPKVPEQLDRSGIASHGSLNATAFFGKLSHQLVPTVTAPPELVFKLVVPTVSQLCTAATTSAPPPPGRSASGMLLQFIVSGLVNHRIELVVDPEVYDVIAHPLGAVFADAGSRKAGTTMPLSFHETLDFRVSRN